MSEAELEFLINHIHKKYDIDKDIAYQVIGDVTCQLEMSKNEI
jgi:hypothetical protein